MILTAVIPSFQWICTKFGGMVEFLHAKDCMEGWHFMSNRMLWPDNGGTLLFFFNAGPQPLQTWKLSCEQGTVLI